MEKELQKKVNSEGTTVKAYQDPQESAEQVIGRHRMWTSEEKITFDAHEFDYPQTSPTESERKKRNLPPFSTWFEPFLPKLGLVTKMHKEGRQVKVLGTFMWYITHTVIKVDPLCFQCHDASVRRDLV